MAGRFGAVVTAMVTPFRADHSLDLDAAQRLAAHLLENGSESLVVAGSTGESPTLTHREKLELFGAVVEAGDTIYCCANCAKQSGAGELRDRA